MSMNKTYDIVMANRQEIVDKLIAQMEKGYASTRAAWNSVGTGRPYNPVSDAVYRGGNRFRLMIAAEAYGFKDSRWMTFKQASENNYQIAPKAQGVLLEKWIFYKDMPKLDENNKPVIGVDGKPETERINLEKPVVNYFRVFNGEQIIGLPELQRKELTEDYYSKTAETFEHSSKCPVSYERQDGAYYSPAEDKIHLPPREAFKNNETRLSVLLHEMAHSTGHESRLNRPIKNTFGNIEYAKEELNAELSSVFLESELGIKMDSDSEMLKDHSNYVKSWISVLKDNPNELFVACANAEQITGFLMENYEKQLEMEKGLIHPEIRVEYFTRNLGGTGLGEDSLVVKHKNFEDAFTAYRNAGLTDGKTLGVNIEGRQIDLVWFNAVNMDNVLYRVAQSPEMYGVNLAANELDELRTNRNKLLDILQKENTYIQLIQSVSEIEMKMTADIQKNNITELIGRFANNARPQDYFEIKLLSNENTNIVELNIREIYANEVIDEKKVTINRKDVITKGIRAFENKELAEWLKAEVGNMDTYNMPMGQPSFTFYSPTRWDALEKHYEKLEHAGYGKNPSEIQQNREKRIREDIIKHGFQPTEQLVNNMIQYERLEGRWASLKEYAAMSKGKGAIALQDMNPEKQDCFRKIVEECRAQEVKQIEECVSNKNFIKNEILMEQMQCMQ